MSSFVAKPPKGTPLRRGDPLARGMVAAWLLNEGGGLKAYDSAGSAHGTLTNGPTWGSGRYGKRLNFVSASDQYVNCGNPTPLQITGPITVALRYRLTTNTPDMQFLSKDKDTGGRAYTLDMDASAGPRFYINGGGNTTTNQAGESRVPVAGDERIAVGVFIPSVSQGVKLYINGKLAGTCSGTSVSSIPTATANVLLSRREYTGFTGPLNGSLDFAFIWNRALPAYQVAEFCADPFRMFRCRRVPVPLRTASVVNYSLDLDPGSFTLTGSSATVVYAALLTTLPGSFSVTASSADLVVGFPLNVSSGTFTLTGASADLRYDAHSDLGVGNFTLTGSDVGFVSGGVLYSDPGSFSVTGSGADLLHSMSLDVDPGSFTLTGYPTDYLNSRLLDLGVGTFTLTGSDVGFHQDFYLDLGVGVFVVTGRPAGGGTGGNGWVGDPSIGLTILGVRT